MTDESLIWGQHTKKFEVDNCNHVWEEFCRGSGLIFYKCKLCGITKFEEAGIKNTFEKQLNQLNY